MSYPKGIGGTYTNASKYNSKCKNKLWQPYNLIYFPVCFFVTAQKLRYMKWLMLILLTYWCFLKKKKHCSHPCCFFLSLYYKVFLKKLTSFGFFLEKIGLIFYLKQYCTRLCFIFFLTMLFSIIFFVHAVFQKKKLYYNIKIYFYNLTV